MPNGLAISPACYQTALVRLYKDKTTTNWGHVSEEEDIHKTRTKPPNNLQPQTHFQTLAQDKIKTTTKENRENNWNKNDNDTICTEHPLKDNGDEIISSITHTYCKYCNTEEDSDGGESYDEDDDGVISSDTSYSNGIRTSGG